MTRIALALPLEAEDRIAAEALRHGHEVVARCSTAHELASRIDAVRPEVALVAATERHLTPNLVTVCDEAGTRILALVGAGASAHHASALGLLESAPMDAPWPELERELSVVRVHSEVQVAAAAPADAPRTGTIIAVWGPAGAPGRTTVAINLAAELAASGATVVLADVDTYSGSIAPALGMLDEAPGFAAACRLAGGDALTHAELDRIGQTYGSARSSFRVLTGIGRSSRWPELSASRVDATLAQCRTWAQFTIVDTGFNLERDEEISSDLFAPRRNAASISGLRAADRVVAVGSADPVGLSRFLRAHVDLVETVDSDRVVVVMNKVRASAIGSSPTAQIAQTLSRFGGIESAAMIPFDHSSLDAAILSGRTLADAAPRSPVRVAIRELALARLAPHLASGGAVRDSAASRAQARRSSILRKRTRND